MIAIVVTIFALGALWVYAVPLAQSKVPSTWVATTWGKIAITGVMLFVVVLVVNMVARKTRIAASI
jgi:hypothetical protein